MLRIMIGLNKKGIYTTVQPSEFRLRGLAGITAQSKSGIKEN